MMWYQLQPHFSMIGLTFSVCCAFVETKPTAVFGEARSFNIVKGDDSVR